MTELADKLRTKVSTLKVQENVYRWKATTIYSSNTKKFTTEAIPIANMKKRTFSLTGMFLYDNDYSNSGIRVTFFVEIDNAEILQMAKEYGLLISVTGFNTDNVKQFNHIKNISWAKLLQTKSVQVFPLMVLPYNNVQKYPENIIILEASVKQTMDDLKLSQEYVLKDIESLYESKEFADFKIKVQNEEFLAHKLILCRSKYFREMFRANMEETKKNEAEIKDVASKDFAELLLYMYTGNISSTKNATLELADAAERFGLIELRHFCEDCVEKKIHSDNVVSIFVYADLRNRNRLMKTAVDFIVENKDKFKDAELQIVFENPCFSEMLLRNYLMKLL